MFARFGPKRHPGRWLAPALAIACVLAASGGPRARAGFVGVGTASNYAVLGLDTATIGTSITASAVTINGNVGVSHLSKLAVNAPSVINGNVYFQDTGSVTGPGAINGSLFQQSMTQAVNDALNASTQDRSLTPTQPTITGDVTSALTISGNGGLNVININGNINLNNANITLTGGASDIFVINVSGSLDLTGTASLLVSGVPISSVLYNFTGGDAANPGKLHFNTHVGDLVEGTMLAPYYKMNLDGTWKGELIGGPMSIGLLSNASVTENSFTPTPVPAPPTVVLMGLGAACLAGSNFWSRRRQSAAA